MNGKSTKALFFQSPKDHLEASGIDWRTYSEQILGKKHVKVGSELS
jgi:hypothetical protein